ncbi:ABC transporter permease [Hymenobacter terrenus]|uniref:ABC transporter permease n=1 Tax=Hymenobacter terrenus TaxID=1629124 RepID=UPI00069645B3|nr:ABC transporter permease [Hymenobacter terrenus]
MVKWIGFRMLRTAIAVWAIASVVFLLSRQDTARAEQLALPDATDLSGYAVGTPVARQAAREAVRQRLGLNLPLFYISRAAGKWYWNGLQNQYHHWLRRAVQGDFGQSFRTSQPVTEALLAALPYSLPLTGTALLLAAGAALAMGQRLAARPRWQQPVRTILAALQALPLFVVALILLLAFANPEMLAWFPAYGLTQSVDVELSVWSRTSTYLMHMALPVIALALTALPELALQLDAALTEELRTDYATTARAKGLAEGVVIRRHALRNALLPTLTQLAELLPALVGGAVVVEVVFALPGMGRLLTEAAAARDYPVLVGGVLLAGTARLLALLLADLLYFWADPRIRWPS